LLNWNQAAINASKSLFVNKRILFLVAHRPGRSPGQRFRFEQYLDYLTEHGFDCQISYLIDAKDDQAFYARGRYVRKFWIFLKSLLRRFADLRKLKEFDAVFLYREAFMLGTTFFEKRIFKKGIPMILDFDDSIWLHDVSTGNSNLAWLKKPSKTEEIIALSQLVIVGNQYLADYAQRFGKWVEIIPTTINTEYYKPDNNKISDQNAPICIGWTGSSTTIKHFLLAIPFLKRIREKYGKRVTFRLIADRSCQEDFEGLEFVRWNKETEIDDLLRVDIGIMPLPDDEWSRGKCGFKGLQYMALAKPAVLSPVGVNVDIVEHGENGFLASNENEWFHLLCELIENPDLRQRIGNAGRDTVVKRFSFESQKQKYLNLFQDVCSNP